MIPSLEWIVHPEISAVNHERNLRMSRLFSLSPFPLPLGEGQALGAWPSEAALFFDLAHASLRATVSPVADRLIFLLLRVICNCPWTLFLMVKEPALGL